MTRHRFFIVVMTLAFAGFLTVGCNSGTTPVTPPPEPFDSSKPTIEGFIAKRGTTEIKDGIVYGGEDIALVISATSHAFPKSCGLPEDAVVEGHLLYSFSSEPPADIPAPGAITQATPPSNQALWRVPRVEQYDTGGGILYTLKVKVTDDCLGNSTTGSITLRAFANQGNPRITATSIKSGIDTSTPATEAVDANGFFEVEKSDQCRITITAESRTLPSICTNRGVAEGDELTYSWSCADPSIKLASNFDPSLAKSVDFAVPVSIYVGGTFAIECRIEDMCTGTTSNAVFEFVVVGSPRITSLTGTANGMDLSYDPYFDNYEVQPGDEVILTGIGKVIDDGLCDSKGINPDLQWSWKELTGSKPTIKPDFEPLPIPNDTSTIEFVVPVVANGTKYSFQCNITDRCNGLTDSKTAKFIVIVGPQAAVTYVHRNSTVINPLPADGRYQVHAGDTIEIRVTADPASGTDFCTQRGVSQTPPVQYNWKNPFENLVLNYDPFPTTSYCDLLFVIPEGAPEIEASLTCRIKDLCNELATEVSLPFQITK